MVMECKNALEACPAEGGDGTISGSTVRNFQENGVVILRDVVTAEELRLLEEGINVSTILSILVRLQEWRRATRIQVGSLRIFVTGTVSKNIETFYFVRGCQRSLLIC